MSSLTGESSTGSSHLPEYVVAHNNRLQQLQRIMRAHCLVGVLASLTEISKSTVHFLVQWAWQPTSLLVVTQCTTNTFIFLFEDLADRRRILHEQPWAFLGHHLCLSEWPAIDLGDTFDLNETYLWINVRYLPTRFHSKDNVERIAVVFPRYSGTYESYESITLGKGILRLRVAVNIHRPLVAGIRIRLPTGRRVTLGITYEEIPPHCRSCGHWDHREEECPALVQSCIKTCYDTSLQSMEPDPRHWTRVYPNSEGSEVSAGATPNQAELHAAAPILPYDVNEPVLDEVSESWIGGVKAYVYSIVGFEPSDFLIKTLQPDEIIKKLGVSLYGPVCRRTRQHVGTPQGLAPPKTYQLWFLNKYNFPVKYHSNRCVAYSIFGSMWTIATQGGRTIEHDAVIIGDHDNAEAQLFEKWDESVGLNGVAATIIREMQERVSLHVREQMEIEEILRDRRRRDSLNPRLVLEATLPRIAIQLDNSAIHPRDFS